MTPALPPKLVRSKLSRNKLVRSKLSRNKVAQSKLAGAAAHSQPTHL